MLHAMFPFPTWSTFNTLRLHIPFCLICKVFLTNQPTNHPTSPVEGLLYKHRKWVRGLPRKNHFRTVTYLREIVRARQLFSFQFCNYTLHLKCPICRQTIYIYIVCLYQSTDKMQTNFTWSFADAHIHTLFMRTPPGGDKLVCLQHKGFIFEKNSCACSPPPAIHP